MLGAINITYTIEFKHLFQFECQKNMNRSCYGINKVFDIKPLVPLFTRNMPTV